MGGEALLPGARADARRATPSAARVEARARVALALAGLLAIGGLATARATHAHGYQVGAVAIGHIWAPPTWALLALDAEKNIVPSQAAKDARAAGLGLITWSLERSGILADGNNGSYYQTIDAAITREGDVLRVIDVLAQDVGVMGIFSDWPATVSFYANCKGR